MLQAVKLLTGSGASYWFVIHEDMGDSKDMPGNFISQIIDADLASGKHKSIVTRFPPEPNGHLHIGHSKSIWLNFSLAEKYQGICHLRFDDTNPEAEEQEYADSIMEDIRWLGYSWDDRLYHASDYFDQLCNFALQLIKAGKAYVDDLSAEEMREYKGDLSTPGKDSPSRANSIERNLELFEKMRAGEFKEGECVLRAKIDMTSPNMNMRDPILYRIRKVSHHRTGDKWCVYPLYDFTHGLSDMIEGITHSICTLEFEDHRPLYDWILDELKTPCHPQQIEFARLNLDYTVMSKRVLRALVEDGHVKGWDDPRMPTIKGLRRLGYTASSIRKFSERVGVTKKNSLITLTTLENTLREDLDDSCPRAMTVLDPIKVVIENYPDDETEILHASIHPKKPDLGKRGLPFGKEIYIDQNDFMEEAPKKFFRLKPGGRVRLKYAYVIECKKVVKDSEGRVTELHCEYFPDTKGGKNPEGMAKVKGIIHWVPVKGAATAEVRLYDRLFNVSNPLGDKSKSYTDFLNPDSLRVIKTAYVEPGLVGCDAESRYQFERLGYFCADRRDHLPEKMVFNRTVTLRDTWAKIQS